MTNLFEAALRNLLRDIVYKTDDEKEEQRRAVFVSIDEEDESCRAAIRVLKAAGGSR